MFTALNPARGNKCVYLVFSKMNKLFCLKFKLREFPFRSRLNKGESMFEMSDSCHYHRKSFFVANSDAVLIFYRTSRLDNRFNPCC